MHGKAGVWWEKMEPIGRERGRGLERKCSEQKENETQSKKAIEIEHVGERKSIAQTYQ